MSIIVAGTTITMNSGAVIQAPVGSTPLYMCRAWVNFNGTGTVAIRASGNVSSITDNGTGFYTVNFSTGMVDTNYAIVGFATNSNNATPAGNMTYGNDISAAAGSVTVKTNVTGTYLLVDSNYACVAVFR